jgi:DNA segregation ATPase FtsK/SpoIIIE-like protein
MEALIRLSQKARAAGILLILATQQPSRQVTSGPILASITAKVTLRMQSIGSRILSTGVRWVEKRDDLALFLIDCCRSGGLTAIAVKAG